MPLTAQPTTTIRLHDRAVVDMTTREQMARQPQGLRSMEWTVDVVLQLQAEQGQLSPEMQILIPYAQVVIWAQLRREMPVWEDVADRWGFDRATAFRWLPALKRARLAVGK
ncbi:MAG TPA: hypothetical protein VGE09_06425 [Pseudoxanthomonas sp.]